MSKKTIQTLYMRQDLLDRAEIKELIEKKQFSSFVQDLLVSYFENQHAHTESSVLAQIEKLKKLVIDAEEKISAYEDILEQLKAEDEDLI